MTEPKTTRCTFCSSEFSAAELEDATGCPKCGTQSAPMSIAEDATIRINVHELRILCIWAENYAVSDDNKYLDNAYREPLKPTIAAICGRLHPQLVALGLDGPLTLTEEVALVNARQGEGTATLHRDGKEET